MRRIASVFLIGSLCGLGSVAASAHIAGASNPCPPGAFDDTEGVVKVIDKTINKEITHVRSEIKRVKLQPGESRTVNLMTSTSLLIRKQLGRSTDGGTYTFELDMANNGPSPVYTTITTGSITDNGTDASGVHTTTRQVATDYDALKSFIPSTRATGHFDATTVHTQDPSKPAPGVRDDLSVNFTDITVSKHDPHGPRSGTYSHVGEINIGGSLDFSASEPVPCPGTPTGPATIAVQRRHVDDGTAERDYRRDAMVTGGTLPAGDTLVSFACGDKPTKDVGGLPTAYTLVKTEDGAGNTVSGKVTFRNETSPNCDPDFGAVPSLTNNATDSPFSHPVTFPGEW
jgi:hypothetical protein